MVASYKQKLAVVKDPAAIAVLPHSQHGRPKLLNSDIDDRVQSYMRAVCDTGGIVNRKIVISAALGITKSLKPSLLPENGGSLELGKPWAESILRRTGFVKRKGTKAARKLPDNFADLKDDFLRRVADTVKEHDIPPSLVVNIDETALPIIPESNWTLEESGARQVSITGLDDKRQLTAFVGCTMDGQVLPPQLLNEGSPDRCHPRNVAFLPQWDIFHTPSHWSNSDTVERFVEKILTPWATKQREELNLPPGQKALIILDVYAAHRTPAVLKCFENAGWMMQFVPGN